MGGACAGESPDEHDAEQPAAGDERDGQQLTDGATKSGGQLVHRYKRGLLEELTRQPLNKLASGVALKGFP